MNIDVRQLRYFLAVAEERSFTRGAERLHMAQPPLSRRIQELEAEIGAPLFERERRPLRLTAAGQILFEQAKLVIEALDRLKARIADVTAAPRSRFTIGLVPSALYIRLPEIMAHLRERALGLEVALAEMDSHEQVRALADGRIDIGIDRVVIDEPQLRHVMVREERLVAALAADDPLLESGGPAPLARLAERPLLLYPRHSRPSYADLVLDALRQNGIVPDKVLEVRELQTALVMVAAGTGRCIVPESVRRLGRQDIAFVDIAEPVHAPLLLRARRHDRSPALRHLLDVYVELHDRWGWGYPEALAQWASELGAPA